MSIAVRPATLSDLPAIVAIYNQAIQKKGLTADLDLITEEDRREWFTDHSPTQYPILVAEEHDKVIGWISLSPYRKGRRALQTTGEVSLYISDTHIGRGVGSDMMQCMLELARSIGYRHIIAILIGTNQRSVGLFEKYGFEVWGTMPGIVEIEGSYLNHCFYGRHLN